MPCAHTHPSLHLVDLLIVSEKFLLVFIILGSEHSYEICQKWIGKELSVYWASAPKVLPWSSSQSIMGVSRGGPAQCFHHTQPFSPRLVFEVGIEAFLCWSGLLTLSPLSLPAGVLRCAVFGEGQHPHWTSKCSPGPWVPGMLTPGLEVWVW